MKYLMIFILISCQSQVDKDREKMQKLINQVKVYQSELDSLNHIVGQEQLEFRKKKGSITIYDLDTLGDIKRKYFSPISQVEFNIKYTNEKIEELKLLK